MLVQISVSNVHRVALNVRVSLFVGNVIWVGITIMRRDTAWCVRVSCSGYRRINAVPLQSHAILNFGYLY